MPVLLLLLLGTLPASAGQDPVSQDPAAPVFRAGVELVRLDVRVVDEHGRPIPDLRADEVEVIEEGEQREILFLQRVDEPQGPYEEVARRTIVGDVSTNRGAPRGHLYVIVFDQHHITPGNEQRARRAAERFLRTRLGRGDRVAIFGLPGPGPQLNFTNDVSQASAELVKVQGSGDRSGLGALGVMRIHEAYQIVRGNEDVLTRVVTRASAQAAATDVLGVVEGLTPTTGGGDLAMAQMLMREDARTLVARADEAARRFLLMLTGLMRALLPIEGRKAVVVFSEGFFADNVTRELEEAAAAAAQSYSVIYGFDLNARVPDIREDSPRGGDQFLEIQDRIEPLGSLAVETDGALIPDANAQLEATLDRIADQSQDYYIVGFEPPASALRDRAKYRRVTIRVRRPGARVSTRTGYALAGETTPADRRRAINLALGAPYPQQGLPIEYTTYVVHSDKPGVHRVVVSLAAELPVADSGESRPADVVFAVRHARDGRVVASGTDVIPLPRESHPGRTTGMGTYKVQFEAPPGDYVMRIVVREPGGMVGSADRQFLVRPLDGPGVTAGDLILGSSQADRLPVRLQAYAAEVLSGVVELYARSAEQLADVTAYMELVPAGAERATVGTPGELLNLRDRVPGVSRPVEFELPLQGVPPGEYVARVVVRARGETVADLVREARVLDGAPPELAAPAPDAAAFDADGLLTGEIARQYLRDLRGRVTGTDRLDRSALLASSGRWVEVERLLGEMPGDETAAAHALLGLARLARGDAGGAVEALVHAFESDPENGRTAFFLGWAHMAAGDERKAISAWRSAAYLEPALVPTHLALADAYLRLAEPALAIQALRAGLTALPDSPELLDRLARLERTP